MNEWQAKQVARFFAFEEDMDDRELYAALFSDTLAPVEPQRIWTPAEYIREEVRRQGHDLSNPLDGELRVQWMREAWDWARVQSAVDPDPRAGGMLMNYILEIGARVESVKNRRGFRAVPVCVGSRLCPPPGEIRGRILRLIQHGKDLPPLEWYLEFEMIHPFVDGNGRSGKVLLNWMAGTLDTPFFPPADLFGYPIANP